MDDEVLEWNRNLNRGFRKIARAKSQRRREKILIVLLKNLASWRLGARMREND